MTVSAAILLVPRLREHHRFRFNTAREMMERSGTNDRFRKLYNMRGVGPWEREIWRGVKDSPAPTPRSWNRAVPPSSGSRFPRMFMPMARAPPSGSVQQVTN
jgi:hypothetical protein